MTYYCLYDREETHGFTHNRVLFTLRWYEVDTLDLYETVIDPTYRNYRRCMWDRIIENDHPWGVYTNLHQGRGRSKNGAGILDADTPAHFVEELTLDEIALYAKIKAQELESDQMELHRGLFVLKL